MHPAGLFVPGPEKNYIALRTDVEGDFPYLPVYHEYVHLIINLNYQHFPVWLNEGFANFLGTATLSGKGGRLGQVNPSDLYVLSQTRLLPVEVLFRVEQNSPYYNEANKTGIFYAESWALVHYLMLDPDRKKDNSLSKYIELIERGGDPLDSAKTAFGDLSDLQKRLNAYVSRTSYMEYEVSLPPPEDSKNYSAHAISQATALARLGDFDVYRGQLDAAQAKIQEAIRLDPALAAPQESMGLLLFRQNKQEEAEKYFSRAVSLDSKSALAYYYDALLKISKGANEKDMAAAEGSLEKAVAINPGLAPAWSNLAVLYSQDSSKLDKALIAAQHAVRSVPGDVHFQLTLAVVLARMARYEDARAIALRITKSADPSAVSQSQQLMAQLDRAQQYSSFKREADTTGAADQMKRRDSGSEDETRSDPVLKHRTADEDNPQAAAAPAPSFGYSMIGTIATVDCAAAPQVLVTLQAATLIMHLHSADISKVSIKSSLPVDAGKSPACAELRGKKARISYKLVAEKPWEGEIVSIELQAAR
jgi:tetratricopeptide (TPR) repeat protein